RPIVQLFFPACKIEVELAAIRFETGLLLVQDAPLVLPAAFLDLCGAVKPLPHLFELFVFSPKSLRSVVELLVLCVNLLPLLGPVLFPAAGEAHVQTAQPIALRERFGVGCGGTGAHGVEVGPFAPKLVAARGELFLECEQMPLTLVESGGELLLVNR